VTDWRDIGEGLKDQWRRMHDGLDRRVSDHFARVERDAPMLFAVIQARRGNPAAIPALLRSNVPLKADDRETLAFYLEGGFEGSPRGPGAPKGLATQIAGKTGRFVDEWKDICRQNHISTHGATDDMRGEAAEFICSELGVADRVDIETVLQYLRKGKA